MSEKNEVSQGIVWSDQEDTPYEFPPSTSTWVREASIEYATEGAVRSLQETVTAIQSNLDRAVEVLGRIERKLGASAG